ncbi:hypothetical protein PRIPAC_79784 [Pristionchus pacificus]|uniref:Peptidase A1 domain-containing protein n=1 Tax=Pristionchus pacificus TaxID=54126 RepID=A0A2A6CPU1_PRIPA|nr:hypothetical protein PRIPAC_79784 [Pristionchus pacificus]|eukprot:PDM80225.1 hypothetical protein PRIPAC_32804 [Pristionchus pacificus]
MNLCQRNMDYWQVVSDTGTSMIAAPFDVVEKVAVNAGANFDRTSGYFTLDCDAQIDSFNLIIGSHEYSIESENMIIHISDTQCALALSVYEGNGFGPQWILGDPFIRQFCNIYDVGNKRMGFARSLQA